MIFFISIKVGFGFCYFHFNKLQFLSSPLYKYIQCSSPPHSIQFPEFADSGNTAGQKGYTSDSEGISAKMVTAVQVRVPSSLPPSEGVLRLHSQKDCHPFTEEQIEDEKCPSNCLADLDLENSISTKCMEIPFRLASSIRQILLITDQTHYQKKETGKKLSIILDFVYLYNWGPHSC